jgi:hypothetical protein
VTTVLDCTENISFFTDRPEQNSSVTLNLYLFFFTEKNLCSLISNISKMAVINIKIIILLCFYTETVKKKKKRA